MRKLALIDIAGDAEGRAHDYGRLAMPIIARAIAHYRTQLLSYGVDNDGLARLVEGFLPIVEDFDAGYVAEMRAIARGAGVAFADIMLINARTELLKLAAASSKGFVDPTPDGCTAIVAAASATAEGSTIHAHNWDWKMEAAEASVMLRVRRNDGPDYLTFTEAGALARFGINEAGLAVAANYLECDRDYKKLGVPLALLRRRVLDHAHMATAVQAVVSTPKSASNNVVLSDAGGMVLDFECAPDEAFEFSATDGLLVHANHWLSLAAQIKLKTDGGLAFPCSFQRQHRGEALLRSKSGAITIEDIRAVLLDNYGSPWSICRPARPSSFTDLSATVASLIMEPGKGRIEVAMLPAENPNFTVYHLT